MLISIDYEGTYERDPRTWEAVIVELVWENDVILVTSRARSDKIPDSAADAVSKNDIHYTEGKDKYLFLKEKGIEVDIWIDDQPQCIGKPNEWEE